VQNGFREIVLTGICLGAYGKDLNPRINLAGLTTEMENIAGLSRIRLSSIEANDLTSALLKMISRSKKVCKHLHIPLQSGDDRILKKMNRHYKAAGFLKLIKAIKKAIPGIAITTDVLVGFPGESETNFSNTADLIKEILPLKAHIFPYSARPGTQAAGFSGMIPAAKISQRVTHLNKIAQTCRDKYMRCFLGRKMPVLVEGRVVSCPGYWQGHTDNYLRVIIHSKEDLKNRILTVKLDKLSGGNFQADFR
jgi:threonylcarbamoyladenosine tRNA methylthiotransferase MtaB